jgi:hypothetical protein
MLGSASLPRLAMLSPDLTQTFCLGAQPMKNRSHELTATIKAVEIFVRRFSVKNFGGLSPTIDTAKLPPQAGVEEGGCAYCVRREIGIAPTTSPSSLGRTGKHACRHGPVLFGIDAACHQRGSRAHGSGADWSSTGGLPRWGTVARSFETWYATAGSSSEAPTSPSAPADLRGRGDEVL